MSAHIGQQLVFPIIVTKFNTFKRFVKDYYIIENLRRSIKLRDYKKPVEDPRNFTGSVRAFIWKNSDS